MSLKKFYRVFSLLPIVIAMIVAGACRSETSDTPTGLIVINAPVAGKVQRILVSEGMSVQENTTLIEIRVLSNPPVSSGNGNQQIPQSAPNPQVEAKIAEEDLQRASVELQRIEPLVSTGGAPQAHLDAARAQYQQAQERLDQFRRNEQIIRTNPAMQPNNSNFGQSAPPSENIIAVRAPVAGNLRVISARVGQIVKAGDPVATISTTH